MRSSRRCASPGLRYTPTIRGRLRDGASSPSSGGSLLRVKILCLASPQQALAVFPPIWGSASPARRRDRGDRVARSRAPPARKWRLRWRIRAACPSPPAGRLNLGQVRASANARRRRSSRPDAADDAVEHPGPSGFVLLLLSFEEVRRSRSTASRFSDDDARASATSSNSDRFHYSPARVFYTAMNAVLGFRASRRIRDGLRRTASRASRASSRGWCRAAGLRLQLDLDYFCTSEGSRLRVTAARRRSPAFSARSNSCSPVEASGRGARPRHRDLAARAGVYERLLIAGAPFARALRLEALGSRRRLRVQLPRQRQRFDREPG